MGLRYYNRKFPKHLRGNKVRNKVKDWFGKKTFFKCRRTFFRLKQVVKGRHWYGEIKDLYKEDMYHYSNIFMAHCKSSFKGKAYNRKQRRKLNISKDLPF
jgi:hypothetical protein